MRKSLQRVFIRLRAVIDARLRKSASVSGTAQRPGG
jgi:hypothetical protein